MVLILLTKETYLVQYTMFFIGFAMSIREADKARATETQSLGLIWSEVSTVLRRLLVGAGLHYLDLRVRAMTESLRGGQTRS